MFTYITVSDVCFVYEGKPPEVRQFVPDKFIIILLFGFVDFGPGTSFGNK